MINKIGRILLVIAILFISISQALFVFEGIASGFFAMSLSNMQYDYIGLISKYAFILGELMLIIYLLKGMKRNETG
jgi:hypothetical protein